MENTKQVRCMDSSILLGVCFTKDVSYNILKSRINQYLITEDGGSVQWFHKSNFEVIEEPSQLYDYINPDHYKQGEKETWEMMLEIWGKKAFITHCQMTAYKYMQRLGKKPDNPIEQDLKKAKWYLDKAEELLNS